MAKKLRISTFQATNKSYSSTIQSKSSIGVILGALKKNVVNFLLTAFFFGELETRQVILLSLKFDHFTLSQYLLQSD